MNCARCGTEFVPRRGGKPQRYCSAKCRWKLAPEDAAAKQRQYRARHPRQSAAQGRKDRRRQQARHPEKVRARNVVRNALRSGRLIKGPCEHASNECAGRVEAHHDDYSRPLEVRWLCAAHHRRTHTT